MCSQSEVMHCYEQIAPLTEKMLLLARSKQWAALPALEAQYSEMVDHLQAVETLEILDGEQLARKYKLLGRILANHDEVRNCVMPQLALLGDALKSLERQENLYKAYGQSNDALS